jgi:hypothetical protein
MPLSAIGGAWRELILDDDICDDLWDKDAFWIRHRPVHYILKILLM